MNKFWLRLARFIRIKEKSAPVPPEVVASRALILLGGIKIDPVEQEKGLAALNAMIVKWGYDDKLFKDGITAVMRESYK